MPADVIIRLIEQSEHELMSLLTARLYLDTIAVSYQGFCTPENLSARNVWTEASECHEWLKGSQGRMTVAHLDGRLVGYAAYCPNREEPRDYDWALEGFFVRPEVQARGVGTRLLGAAVDDMAAAGGKRLVVATFASSQAERYYLATGAQLLFETSNEYFGQPNRVSFLGWELDQLARHLCSRLSSQSRQTQREEGA